MGGSSSSVSTKLKIAEKLIDDRRNTAMGIIQEAETSQLNALRKKLEVEHHLEEKENAEKEAEAAFYQTRENFKRERSDLAAKFDAEIQALKDKREKSLIDLDAMHSKALAPLNDKVVNAEIVLRETTAVIDKLHREQSQEIVGQASNMRTSVNITRSESLRILYENNIPKEMQDAVFKMPNPVLLREKGVAALTY